MNATATTTTGTVEFGVFCYCCIVFRTMTQILIKRKIGITHPLMSKSMYDKLRERAAGGASAC